MSLSNLSVDRLLHPGNFIHQLVAILFEHFKCQSVLCIDYPNKQEPVFLKLVEGQVQNLLIHEGFVSNSDSSSWVCGRELPWRVAGNHIKEASPMLKLGSCQLVVVQVEHVVAYRNRPELLDVGFLLEPL